MKILISADENPLIFGCQECGCVFIAHEREYYYDSFLDRIFCVCPVCGARCKGEKESCYICKNGQLDSNGCDYKEYDAEHCEYFNVDKSALWRELGIYDQD